MFRRSLEPRVDIFFTTKFTLGAQSRYLRNVVLAP